MLNISQMYFVKFNIFTRFILHVRNVLENLEKVEPKKPSIVTFDTIPVIWIVLLQYNKNKNKLRLTLFLIHNTQMHVYDMHLSVVYPFFILNVYKFESISLFSRMRL